MQGHRREDAVFDAPVRGDNHSTARRTHSGDADPLLNEMGNDLSGLGVGVHDHDDPEDQPCTVARRSPA